MSTNNEKTKRTPKEMTAGRALFGSLAPIIRNW